MRLSKALQQMHDGHKMNSNQPLVITFSSLTARNQFVRLIEDDIGAPGGELREAMYDGIRFECARPKEWHPISPLKFWAA